MNYKRVDKQQGITLYIKHLAESANFKGSTLNKHRNGLIVNRFKMPNVSYTCPLKSKKGTEKKMVLVLKFAEKAQRFTLISACHKSKNGKEFDFVKKQIQIFNFKIISQQRNFTNIEGLYDRSKN